MKQSCHLGKLEKSGLEAPSISLISNLPRPVANFMQSTNYWHLVNTEFITIIGIIIGIIGEVVISGTAV